MMWYEILIEDEFIDYFGNDDNIFYIIENEKKVLAPTFSRFADIVHGLTYAWSFPQLLISEMSEFQEECPDFYRAFVFCKKNQPSFDERHLNKIWKSIPVGFDFSHYRVDLNKLNAEQCAVLLMYPFWSRMGGSFEISFQEDGRLKKYILALKEKHNEL